MSCQNLIMLLLSVAVQSVSLPAVRWLTEKYKILETFP